ncbi:RECEPTOR-LIKE SERINE/THREONINE-PROTEIN KINASE SD1-8 [Salix koriyanagi]|uniref:RECEPTOR-LIKE SERINE/THREONINE-PROTEIN KINASE SD1-8 n=1 Tax=Salix koriyanagi TaxID=2511006 RepID=A0A9Q0UEE1_9ROSI|nr:RECEPTOR-LIKE SERINE/THREONINE-PROTEIN KINASE SD1-8 [Salix koriyanagi]
MNASTVPMDSSKLVLLLSLLYILLLQPSLNAAQPNFTHYHCNWNNVKNSNYTADSNFRRNLNRVLSSIASATQIDHYGFYNLSAGEVPERVNAFAMCRGDVAVDVCRSCVNNSTRKILEVCPNEMEVVGVYELCMIRYSNRSMFGVVDDYYYFNNVKGTNVLDVTLFNQALQTLFSRLIPRAASGNSFKKFASGNQSAGVETVYATVQCTPDLSEEQCSGCLIKLFRNIPNGSVQGKNGAALIYLSCNLRWDIVKFFNGTLEILSPPPQILSPTALPAPSQGKKSNTAVRIIVITVVPVVGVMILVICICLFIRTRKQREKERVEIANKIESAESLQFTFSTIQDATEDFSEKNRLGQGGFGVVYKAWRNWREGTAQAIIDPVLSSGLTTEMMRCINIGLLCVQENVADRPTMALVILMLSSSSLTLQIPSQPAFFVGNQSNMSSSSGQNSRVTDQSSLPESERIPLSRNNVSISELYPR